MGKASRRKNDVDRAARVAQRLEQTRQWHEQRVGDRSLPLEDRLEHLLSAGMPEDREALDQIRSVGVSLTAFGWALADVAWDGISWDSPVHKDDERLLLDSNPGADELSASVTVDVLWQRPLYELTLPCLRGSDMSLAEMYFSTPDELLAASNAASNLRPGDDLAPLWGAFPTALKRDAAEHFDRGLQIAVG